MENNELKNSKEHLNQEENEVVVLVEAFVKRIKYIKERLGELEASIYGCSVGKLGRLQMAFNATEDRKNGKVDTLLPIIHESLDYKEALRELESFEDTKDLLRLDKHIENLKSAISLAESEATKFLAGCPCPSLTINGQPRPVVFKNGKLRFVGSEKEAKDLQSKTQDILKDMDALKREVKYALKLLHTESMVSEDWLESIKKIKKKIEALGEEVDRPVYQPKKKNSKEEK